MKTFGISSYKMRKGQFLLKDKRKDCTAKLLHKLKHPHQLKMLWFFSDEKNFNQDQMVNSQNNCWLALYLQDILMVMKTKHLVHIMMFGVVTSDGDVMPLFLLTRPWTVAYIMFGGGSAALDHEVGYRSSNKTLCYVIQAGEPSVGCQKISVTTSILTSICITSQIAITLVIMCKVQSNERLKNSEQHQR